MLAKKRVAHHFSKAVAQYDEVSTFHRLCAEKLCQSIKNDLTDHVKILEVGSFTGVLTKQLQAINPNTTIIRTDLHLAGARQENIPANWSFIQADGEQPPFKEAQFDLIVSNACFQWFHQLEQSLPKLIKLLKPNGKLCFSQFTTPSLEPVHSWYNEIQRSNSFLKLLSPTELQRICSSYELISFNKFMQSYDFTNFSELRTYLKHMGIQAPSESSQRMTREQYQHLQDLVKTTIERDKYINLQMAAALVLIKA